MIALYIVGGIILFILLLLFTPITLLAEYDDSLSAKARYFFFTFKITNRDKKESKRKKNRSKKKKTEKNNKDKKESSISKNLKIIKKSFDFKGFEGAKRIIKLAAYLIKKVSRLIRRHLIVKELLITISVGGEDAAETSLKYGKMCAGLFPSLGVITGNLKVRKFNYDISPDFLRNDNKAYLYAKLQMKPVFLIGYTISVLFHLFVRPLADRKIKNIKNKAVQKNEGK